VSAGKRIWVVDDDRNTRLALTEGLADEGFEVTSFACAEDAVVEAARGLPDLLVVDLVLPGLMNGLSLLRHLKSLSADTAVIMVSGEGTLSTAVEAMKDGAADFITKPVRLRELQKTVARVLETRQLVAENTRLKEEVATLKGRVEIVGAESGLREILEIVEQVARSKSSVLLTGESGTGKEVIANAIHRQSPRAAAPFVKVHCAALPETLLEAELFGFEKGAFTGAAQTKPGRFEIAQGGTLLLDEVGEIPLATQVKLLRILQEGDFERLGANETRRADVRIIAATNRDLRRAIEEKTFREDLFYRLDVVSIEVPPLRGRRNDIPLFVRHFIEKYARENGKTVTGLTPDAMKAIQEYSWPGNVRELENAIERAVVLTKSPDLGVEILPPAVRQAPPVDASGLMTFAVGTSLAEMERVAILRALDETGGNRERAANLLGIGVATLYRRLKDFGAEAK
jgi:DNA-binding NtrC family response regulator